jgi:hypothetical protein
MSTSVWAIPTPEIDKRNALYESGKVATLLDYTEWLVLEEVLYLDRPESIRGLMLDFLGIDESKIAEELLALHEHRQNIERWRVR